MTIQKTHSLETVGGVSLATGGAAMDRADVRRMPESVDGLSLDLLDALTQCWQFMPVILRVVMECAPDAK